MAIPTKSAPARTMTRLWRTPTSRAAIAWLLFAACYTALFYILYLLLLHAKSRLISGPFFDIIFRCGVMSYLMILGVAAYSLRARFFHGLPWKAQNWVWAHLWVGIASLLLALLHGDFRFILHFNCSGLSCVTDQYLAMPSLYGLIFLVFSGAIGKLLDRWQTHVIAQDARSNGVGIARAIEARLLEQEYAVERFCAGKSDAFKGYCAQALEHGRAIPLPVLQPQEQQDFQQAYMLLLAHSRLQASLQQQQQAYLIVKTWRRIHMLLVPLILLIISYHAIFELVLILQGQIHVPKV